MRKFAVTLSVLLLLLMAAAVALPFLVPVGAIVAQVEREVEVATGRELTIGGRVDLSYFPSIAVTADDVQFAGIRQGEDLLRVKRLAVRLRLIPLLRGRAEVERFVLTEPFIDLTVDRQGRPNWNVSFTRGPSPAAGDGTPPANAGGTDLVADLSLSDVEVVDGRLRYTDARTGMVREATDVNITLSMPALDEALELEAEMKLNGTPLALDVVIDPVRPLLAGGTAGLDLRLSGAGSNLAVKGQVERQGDAPVNLAGDLALKVASLDDLVRAATGAAPADLPVDDLSLTGRLTGTSVRLGLAGLKAVAGDLTADGDLNIRLDGPRPALAGTLSLPRLELDRYLPADEPPPAASDGGDAAVPPAASQGWSREAIDLSAMKVFDLDLDLRLAGLLFKGVETGPAAMGLKLADGRLNAVLADTPVFGGMLGGRLSLDVSRPALNLGLVARAQGVQAEPLLIRFADFNRLTGTTDGTLDIKATGANQQELVGSLNGKGEVLFRDGAVKGINLAHIIRSAIGQGGQEPPQTDFAEMGGAFTITNGTVATEDFRLLAPLLRVAGKGTVNLPNRRVDMRLGTRLVASLEGQGTGNLDADGINVPVRVRGTFDNLTYAPDLSASVRAALRDPAKAREQIERLRHSKDGARSLLDSVLGRKP
ncbi:AsmA family protein [Niveispirillum fermenti]|uniref:AsmA family protein n=1 Tax=Niveispirillum fermenti TaxID=1233113 RepID=UPI003A85463F